MIATESLGDFRYVLIFHPPATMPRYNPSEIEPRWQAYWETHQTFKTPEKPGAKKRYVLDMFPYPSGDGLHVGHPEGYTATDIVARFARARGESVLHPMGFDAFGLPAEEHAIRTGEHPRVQTQRNIDTFTRQLKSLGFSYDWDRCIATTDENYVRWTQWIFTVLYDTWFDAEQQKGRPISELPIPAAVAGKGDLAIEVYQDDHRLAYESDAPVNWCPALGTVLANEEVQGGVSEVGGHPVQRIPLRQWMLRITDYADRLLVGLDDLDWPTGIKKLQSDWIGRSTGAEVDFYVDDNPGVEAIRVYTTRPDTLFGATYMVLAPEHSLVDLITADEHRESVESYIQAASFKSERDRTADAKTKTGVFTGAMAINPATDKPIPIWVADYVLAGYGTGAIMAVPAHDVRDFEFAMAMGLPVVPVVDPPADLPKRESILAGKECYVASGLAINSGEFDGQSTENVKDKLVAQLAAKGVAKVAVNYKLRDWLFSRQRFWGEPFPVLHEIDDAGQPTGRRRLVPDDQLPVRLPQLEDYKPHGKPEPPLGKAGDDWLIVELDGRRYRRETNTMPQWAGSCWYFLRYIDPHNSDAFVDAELEKAWMPVDLYVGGAEHAVLHLLYSRFWHKVLHDRGYVHGDEPFAKLVNQGMILGDTGEKMSKSRGNVINPDVVVSDYGADSLRLYEMFMGPLEATKPWNMEGVGGVRSFLDRTWRLIVDERADGLTLSPAIVDQPCAAADARILHGTIKKVTEDIEALSFNTAIARMMETTNHFTKCSQRSADAMRTYCVLLAPFAPHIAEELWRVLGGDDSVSLQRWPDHDESLLFESVVEIAVQINGKLRSKISVPADADSDAMIAAAVADAGVSAHLSDKAIVKQIAVPGRLVNFVVR